MSFWRAVTFHGRAFRVDAGGVYEELLDLPLGSLEPSEESQNPAKVERYAQLYRRGSPFPAISVMGVTSAHATYRITNGHHRWQAARQVGAASLPSWACFYVEYHRDADHRPFPTLARLAETNLGRDLARALELPWCAHCGSSLNVSAGEELCRSCQIARANGVWHSPNAFERWAQTLEAGHGE